MTTSPGGPNITKQGSDPLLWREDQHLLFPPPRGKGTTHDLTLPSTGERYHDLRIDHILYAGVRYHDLTSESLPQTTENRHENAALRERPMNALRYAALLI